MTARDDIEAPTDDLRALFAAERDVSAVERAAIRDKLAVSIAAPAPATAAIATTKLAWIAAAAIAAAAGLWWLTRDRAPAPPPPVPAPQVAPPAPAPESVAPTITATAPEPPPPVVEAPLAEPPPVKPPSQPELLAKAWQALPRDAAEALRLVELDTRLHAKGALAEEREALHVQALAALDRPDEARALATKFVAQYPRSVHRKRVEAVLQ